jgi:tetratricopeptide (TPR) repeat protein
MGEEMGQEIVPAGRTRSGRGYQSLYQSAQQAHRARDHSLAIERFSELVDGLLAEGREVLLAHPDLRALLDDAGQQVVQLLRWERAYERAIALQERLATVFTERALALRMHAANLRIEGGQEKAGLEDLREIAEADLGNIWGWMTLGTAYQWLGRDPEAEECLRRAASLQDGDPRDRALAYRYLFDLFGIQNRIHEAVDTWEEMCSLDPTLRATLPELCRVLIHWRYFQTAQNYLKLDRLKLRRLFFSGLIDASAGAVAQALKTWGQVAGHDPQELQEGHDEFAEACVRVILPRRALDLLEPMIQRGEVHHRRLIVAGLAYAQLRVLNRATGTLDVALRLADLERPRRTRPGGRQRILDSRARVLYGQVRIDPDVREQLDRYFIPMP